MPDPQYLIEGWWTDPYSYWSQETRDYNFKNFLAYFWAHGWTLQAICGAAGNVDVESRFNPGFIEGRPREWPANMNAVKKGIGLTQWTSSNAPPQKHIKWCNENNIHPWYSGWNQCFHIYREGINNYQWASGNVQGITFPEFTGMTETPERMSDIFARAYERARSVDLPSRRTAARHYYELALTIPVEEYPEVPDDPPIGPEPTPGPETRVPIWLLFKIKEDNNRNA